MKELTMSSTFKYQNLSYIVGKNIHWCIYVEGNLAISNKIADVNM